MSLEDDGYIDYEEDYYDQSQPIELDSNGILGKYEFLMKDEIEKEKDKKIEEFEEYSSLPKPKAELVLMMYNWNIEILNNDWFDKMDKIKQISGLTQTKESNKKLTAYFKKNKIPKGNCLICDTEIDPGDEISLECQHQFCSYCFTAYLQERVKDQLTVLSTHCPLKDCNYIVTSDIFNKCLKDDRDSLKLYEKALIRNFTESNSDIKLCPNPKCDAIVKVPGHGMIDIKCPCGYTFCFKCLKESHRPCDCEMVQMWEKKCQSDGENSKWLLVNTKQCPNCHKYIEKNQGCNHMTCQKKAGGCGYEFCWICMGEWKPHGTSWYKCVKYNPTEVDKQKEKMKLDAKFELEKYNNYFDSYLQEKNAYDYAVKLKEKINNYKEHLEKEKNQPHLELVFLDEAIQTVIDCHRILKNTYIFGYYMKNDTNKGTLYKHHQEMLRVEADKLHELLEMEELPKILKINELEEFNKNFANYKDKILTIMSATTKFKEGILVDIENNPDYIDYNFLKNSMK
jgi:ariadne-1